MVHHCSEIDTRRRNANATTQLERCHLWRCASLHCTLHLCARQVHLLRQPLTRLTVPGLSALAHCSGLPRERTPALLPRESVIPSKWDFPTSPDASPFKTFDDC